MGIRGTCQHQHATKQVCILWPAIQKKGRTYILGQLRRVRAVLLNYALQLALASRQTDRPFVYLEEEEEEPARKPHDVLQEEVFARESIL